MSDDDDGWELLVGPAHYQTNSEKNLYEFCNAAKNGDLEKVCRQHFSTRLACLTYCLLFFCT